jgi:hypothetical protein
LIFAENIPDKAPFINNTDKKNFNSTEFLPPISKISSCEKLLNATPFWRIYNQTDHFVVDDLYIVKIKKYQVDGATV